MPWEPVAGGYTKKRKHGDHTSGGFVRNTRQYEKLRAKGMSKERAARITNSDNVSKVAGEEYKALVAARNARRAAKIAARPRKPYYNPSAEQRAAAAQRRTAQAEFKARNKAEKPFRRVPRAPEPWLSREHIRPGPSIRVGVAATVGGTAAYGLHRDRVRKSDTGRKARNTALGAATGAAATEVAMTVGGQTVKAKLKRDRARIGSSPHDDAVWSAHKAKYGIRGPLTRHTPNRVRVAVHSTYPKSLPGWRAQRVLAFKNRPQVAYGALAAGALAGAAYGHHRSTVKKGGVGHLLRAGNRAAVPVAHHQGQPVPPHRARKRHPALKALGNPSAAAVQWGETSGLIGKSHTWAFQYQSLNRRADQLAAQQRRRTTPTRRRRSPSAAAVQWGESSGLIGKAQPWSDEKLARRKKEAAALTTTGALIGLSALGAKGTKGAITRLKPGARTAKIAQHLDEATSHALVVGAGIGGVGGLNNAAIGRQEANRVKMKKGATMTMSAFGVEHEVLAKGGTLTIARGAEDVARGATSIKVAAPKPKVPPAAAGRPKPGPGFIPKAPPPAGSATSLNLGSAKSVSVGGGKLRPMPGPKRPMPGPGRPMPGPGAAKPTTNGFATKLKSLSRNPTAQLAGIGAAGAVAGIGTAAAVNHNRNSFGKSAFGVDHDLAKAANPLRTVGEFSEGVGRAFGRGVATATAKAPVRARAMSVGLAQAKNPVERAALHTGSAMKNFTAGFSRTPPTPAARAAGRHITAGTATNRAAFQTGKQVRSYLVPAAVVGTGAYAGTKLANRNHGIGKSAELSKARADQAVRRRARAATRNAQGAARVAPRLPAHLLGGGKRSFLSANKGKLAAIGAGTAAGIGTAAYLHHRSKVGKSAFGVDHEVISKDGVNYLMGPLSARRGQRGAAYRTHVANSAGGTVLGAGVGAGVGAGLAAMHGRPARSGALVGASIGALTGSVAGGVRGYRKNRDAGRFDERERKGAKKPGKQLAVAKADRRFNPSPNTKPGLYMARHTEQAAKLRQLKPAVPPAGAAIRNTLRATRLAKSAFGVEHELVKSYGYDSEADRHRRAGMAAGALGTGAAGLAVGAAHQARAAVRSGKKAQKAFKVASKGKDLAAATGGAKEAGKLVRATTVHGGRAAGLAAGAAGLAGAAGAIVHHNRRGGRSYNGWYS